jgi:protein gp37
VTNAFIAQIKKINQEEIMKTNIEWADYSWNPVIGCSKVNTGCKNCYAEKMANRLASMPGEHAKQYRKIINMGGKWNETTCLVKSQLKKPYGWKKPRRIFVCSMGDLFHPSVKIEWIESVFMVMQDNPQHTFLLLTKRPHVMNLVFKSLGINAGGRIAPNIWVGFSAANQDTFNGSIGHMAQIPAAVRFVSIEPFLGKIELPQYPVLDWVIAGGESGGNARPTNPAWVRSLVDQCEKLEIPLFFKQWGEWAPFSCLTRREQRDKARKGLLKSYSFDESGFKLNLAQRSFRIGKKQAGNTVDGFTWENFPKIDKRGKHGNQGRRRIPESQKKKNITISLSQKQIFHIKKLGGASKVVQRLIDQDMGKTTNQEEL